MCVCVCVCVCVRVFGDFNHAMNFTSQHELPAQCMHAKGHACVCVCMCVCVCVSQVFIASGVVASKLRVVPEGVNTTHMDPDRYEPMPMPQVSHPCFLESVRMRVCVCVCVSGYVCAYRYQPMPMPQVSVQN